jgi:hypothetical protein
VLDILGTVFYNICCSEDVFSSYVEILNFYNTSSSFINCTFVNCSSVSSKGRGGAICIDSPSVVIDGCIFKNCSVRPNDGVAVSSDILIGGGGALYLRSNVTHITHCTFVDCEAMYGGAIALNTVEIRYTSSSMEDCIFENNVASIRGGGLYLHSIMLLLLNRLSFQFCKAEISGGAIYYISVNSSVLKFNCSNFTNCEVTGTGPECHGGAIGIGGVSPISYLQFQFLLLFFGSNVVAGGVHGSDMGVELPEVEPFIKLDVFDSVRSTSGGVRGYYVEDDEWEGSSFFPDYFGSPINISNLNGNTLDWYLCGSAQHPCTTIMYGVTQLDPSVDGYVNVSLGEYHEASSLVIPSLVGRGVVGAGVSVTYLLVSHPADLPWIDGGEGAGNFWLSNVTVCRNVVVNEEGERRVTPPLIRYGPTTGYVKLSNALFISSEGDKGVAITSSLISIDKASVNISSCTFENITATVGNGGVISAVISSGVYLLISGSNFTYCVVSSAGATGGAVSGRLEHGGVFEVLGMVGGVTTFMGCGAGSLVSSNKLNNNGDDGGEGKNETYRDGRGGAVYLFLVDGFRWVNETNETSYFSFYGVKCIIFVENIAKEGKHICLLLLFIYYIRMYFYLYHHVNNIFSSH